MRISRNENYLRWVHKFFEHVQNFLTDLLKLHVWEEHCSNWLLLSLSLSEWTRVTRNDPPNKLKWSIHARSVVDSAQWYLGITCCILVILTIFWLFLLGHSYMTVRLWHQKTMQMELKGCCKVDIHVNSPLSPSSFGSRFGTARLRHYTWRVDSYIFLLNLVHSCAFVWNMSSVLPMFILLLRKNFAQLKKKNDLTLQRRRMGANFNFFTFVHIRQ